MPITSDDLKLNALFSLEGKTAVLTGASGFLGRTFALALLANGARVVALGRSERLQTEAAAWANQFGADKITVQQIDMYNVAALDELCRKIAAEEKSVDVLINNAHELGSATGFNVPEGSLENSTFDQWQRNLQGGVYWAVQTTQTLGVKMKQQGKGSIINIATMYASVAPRPQLYRRHNEPQPAGLLGVEGRAGRVHALHRQLLGARRHPRELHFAGAVFEYRRRRHRAERRAGRLAVRDAPQRLYGDEPHRPAHRAVRRAAVSRLRREHLRHRPEPQRRRRLDRCVAPRTCHPSRSGGSASL